MPITDTEQMYHWAHAPAYRSGKESAAEFPPVHSSPTYLLGSNYWQTTFHMAPCTCNLALFRLAENFRKCGAHQLRPISTGSFALFDGKRFNKHLPGLGRIHKQYEASSQLASCGKEPGIGSAIPRPHPWRSPRPQGSAAGRPSKHWTWTWVLVFSTRRKIKISSRCPSNLVSHVPGDGPRTKPPSSRRSKVSDFVVDRKPT